VIDTNDSQTSRVLHILVVHFFESGAISGGVKTPKTPRSTSLDYEGVPLSVVVFTPPPPH